MRLFFAVIICLFAIVSSAQQDTSTPLFQRFPSLPPLQLLREDSTLCVTADIQKNKPVLIVFFSPDCSHCQHEAEQIVAHEKELKPVEIIMVSTYPLARLKAFGESYGLAKLDNVVITKDPYYFLITFFNIHNFPFMALYNKKGKLITTFDGGPDVDKIIATFKNNQ